MRTEEPRPDPDPVDGIVAQWAEQRPGLDVSALHVFGRLHRAYLRHHAVLAELFGRFGTHVAAFDVLAALRRSGPPYRMTAGELADTALISSGGITMRVDRLVKAGLVVRERDTHDRRVVYVRLTAAGFALVDRVAEAHFAHEQVMLHGLSASDRGELARLLGALVESMETMPETGHTPQPERMSRPERTPQPEVLVKAGRPSPGPV